jgi:hypothetical protein
VHARSTTIRGRPESVDEGIAFCRDEVLPMCRELPGCLGLSMIVDRESGRCITTTSWDSIESLRATTTQLQPVRQRVADLLGGTAEVAEWEIAVMHRDHRSADGACTRVTWLRGDPAAMDRAADVFKLALMPEIETFDGFCGVSFLINREGGLAVSSLHSTAARRWKEAANTLQRCAHGAPPKHDWRSWRSASSSWHSPTSTCPSWSDPAPWGRGPTPLPIAGRGPQPAGGPVSYRTGSTAATAQSLTRPGAS